MDLLARVFLGGLHASTPSPTSDFWYQPIGSVTAAGVRVDADGAQKLSAWWRGREIIANAMGMTPMHVLERLPENRGSQKAESHQLYDVLHRKPNAETDAYQWRRQMTYDVIDYGWAFAEIGYGARWTLTRIDPRNVLAELVTRGPRKGQYVFHVRDRDTGQSSIKTRDDLFYLRGAEGKGILARAADALGLALVTEQYAGKVFSKGVLAGATIEVPGAMTPESARAMAQSFVTAGGEWHMPRVLPQGAKLSTLNGLTPEDAQMLLSRKFSVTDIARWLGLPPHMLFDLDRSTNNNIEHQGQELVTYHLGPWFSLWEFAADDQLMMQWNRFYVRFNRDALVRGDIQARWNAHVQAVNAGIKSVDEVRAVEDLPLRGGEADELRMPQNITGKPMPDAAQGDQPDDTSDESPVGSEDAAKAQRFAQLSAERVLRKEVTALQKLAVRHAGDGDAFAAAVSEFYAKHVALVAEALDVPSAMAASYCAGQAQQALADWLSACETWQTPHYAAGLAGLALEAA